MKTSALYLRAIVFGVTDSLVSTVGLLAGIDISGVPHSTIILTGLVYGFVEAFSMAVGNFLSEESAQEYATQQKAHGRSAFVAGVIMFVAFVLASFIPLAPYLLSSSWLALVWSVIASILALFLLGLASGRLARLPMLVRGLRMALLGGAAIVIGAAVGLILKA
jgi:VIT1/CCC1 family predicted Fe2+/Mn2+ transporter